MGRLDRRVELFIVSCDAEKIGERRLQGGRPRAHPNSRPATPTASKVGGADVAGLGSHELPQDGPRLVMTKSV